MENFTPIHSALYAAAGTLMTGLVIKIVTNIVDARKNTLDEHLVLRKELREELDIVREELELLRTQLDEWKQKYYDQVELTNALKVDILKLTDELEEYKRISGIHPTQ